MTSSYAPAKPDLTFKPNLLRNRGNKLLTAIAGLFSLIAVVPLIAVLAFVLFKGISVIRPMMFFQLPPPPGLSGGGIGNALIGTLVVTGISCLFSIPVGVGGGTSPNTVATTNSLPLCASAQTYWQGFLQSLPGYLSTV
jgi:phosphate transport system permease protein